MGRQSYLTRLALGRSPFEPPERDESGQFILGARAHDYDDVDGYAQQFDERGHPQNRASRAAARELRRAKNDVLSTVGVVVNKSEASKSRWSRMTYRQKVESVISENDYGLGLAIIDLPIMSFSSWWLSSLRSRIQTFKSYTTLPVTEILKSESRLIGLPTMITSGMIFWAISWSFKMWLHDLVEFLADGLMDYFRSKRNMPRHYQAESRVSNISKIGKIAVFVISGPIQVLLMLQIQFFSTLQSLHLIPVLNWPRPSSLLPFGRTSPIQLPQQSAKVSLQSMISYGCAILVSPIVAAWYYDCLRYHVESWLFRFFCRCTIKPDMADEFSIQAAIEDDMDESNIPGLGRSRKDGTFGPAGGLWAEIRQQLASIRSLKHKITSWISQARDTPSPLSPTLEVELRLRTIRLSREIMADLERGGQAQVTESRREEIRRIAARRAFAEHEIRVPDDIDLWIGDRVSPASPLSTPTSDPVVPIFPFDDFLRAEERAHGDLAQATIQTGREIERTLNIDLAPGAPNRVEALTASAQDGILTIRQSTIPEAVPEEVRLGNGGGGGQQSVWSNEAQGPDPNTGAVGASSGTSVVQGYVNPLGPSFRRAGTVSIQPENVAPMLIRPIHRVTTLSNHSSTALATRASDILATVILLPLESFCLRTIIQAFLSSPAPRPGAVAGANAVLADVRPRWAWFGGEPGFCGKLKYASVVLLTLGLETWISSASWGLLAGLNIRMGRRFGWGQL